MGTRDRAPGLPAHYSQQHTPRAAASCQQLALLTIAQ
jgi:hypothetical protein